MRILFRILACLSVFERERVCLSVCVCVCVCVALGDDASGRHQAAELGAHALRVGG